MVAERKKAETEKKLEGWGCDPVQRLTYEALGSVPDTIKKEERKGEKRVGKKTMWEQCEKQGDLHDIDSLEQV